MTDEWQAIRWTSWVGEVTTFHRGPSGPPEGATVLEGQEARDAFEAAENIEIPFSLLTPQEQAEKTQQIRDDVIWLGPNRGKTVGEVLDERENQGQGQGQGNN